MTDTVTLKIPRDPRYFSVARLVVGGFGAGLSLSYDVLDELQLAIGSLLDSYAHVSRGPLTVSLESHGDMLHATIGAFDEHAISQALGKRGSGDGQDLDLRRVLDTIVDGIDVHSDGDDGGWITLTKRVTTTA